MCRCPRPLPGDPDATTARPAYQPSEGQFPVTNGQSNAKERKDMRRQDPTQESALWPTAEESTAHQPDPTVVAALLAENVGDYMSLGLFSHVLSIAADGTPTDARARCLRYLEHMIQKKYISIGTVKGTTFHPWAPGTVGSPLAAIASHWAVDSPADYENLRDIAWLANTPKGDHIAHNYRAKWVTSAHISPTPETGGGATVEPFSPLPRIKHPDKSASKPHHDYTATRVLRRNSGPRRWMFHEIPVTLRHILGATLVLAAGLAIGLVLG